MTRRMFSSAAASLLSWPASLWASRAGASGEPEFRWEYRAKAVVLLMSVPIFSRDNVGGGYLRLRERTGGGTRQIRLEFAAGSLPERAAGLNRLGLIEETVVEQGGALESANYFGFMTASNERSLEQARTALRENRGGAVTAIRGDIREGKVRNHLLRLADLANARWDRRLELTEEVRRRLSADEAAAGEIATGTGSQPATFLYSVHRAMRSNEAETEGRFVHNGELLTLATWRRPDPKQGESLAARKLALRASGVMAMTGRIRKIDGKELSQFQLWYERDAAELAPLRFEFRPRSFLKLSFERAVDQKP